MHGDLVASPSDLGGEIGMSGGHAPEHEKRRPPAQLVEGVEERRRRAGVGAVVEGERHMAGSADARQGGRPADTTSAHAGRGGQHLRQAHERHRPGDADGDSRGGFHWSQLNETLPSCWLASWARTLSSKVVSWAGVNSRPFTT